MNRRDRFGVALCRIAFLVLLGAWNSPAGYALDALAGTGSIAGAVTAPKQLKAARVYARNLDKNMLYMVYTSAGRYQAPNLLPGSYQVWVEKRGFESELQKARVDAGSSLKIDFSLRETKPRATGQGSFLGARASKDVQLVPYDQLYPPGPGHDLVEKTCVTCHGKNFLPTFHKKTEEWDAAIGMMMNPKAEQGAQIPPGTFSDSQRKMAAEYLAAHFGPDSPTRGLRIDAEMPLDENALGRAMYVEYFLPLDKAPNRRTQETHIDNDGNVWYTDFGIPNHVGRLDPRTAQFTDYPLPQPDAHPHGLTIDSKGYVFWAETVGLHLGRLDPRTGKMDRFPMDEKGIIPGGHGHTPVLDSKENIWFTVIIGNKLGKWDRKTEKATLWEVPTPRSYPYGITIRNDKIYFAEFHGCKVTRFDPETEKFTEYPSKTQPCTIRRLGLDSKAKTLWYGVFSSGKLGRLDTETGENVEYDIPMPFSEPYDVWLDSNDQVWISDAGQGGTLIRYDPQAKKFTYYPTPRRTDQPKFDISRDGAIWYPTRSADQAAVGVLYPDVSKMSYAARR